MSSSSSSSSEYDGTETTEDVEEVTDASELLESVQSDFDSSFRRGRGNDARFLFALELSVAEIVWS